MSKDLLLKQLSEYAESSLITPAEHIKLKEMYSFVASHPSCFNREPGGHVTGSAWLMNYEETHVLLTHHKKLNMWLQLGGHAEGDTDIAAVALREAEEESGIEGITCVDKGIFDIDIHPIPGPCGKHYDVRYLLKAPHKAHYFLSDESNDLAWVPFHKIADYSQEESLLRMAHKTVQRIPYTRLSDSFHTEL